MDEGPQRRAVLRPRRQRELETDGLITNRRPWPETSQAYRDLLADRSSSLAVILNWDDDTE